MMIRLVVPSSSASSSSMKCVVYCLDHSIPCSLKKSSALHRSHSTLSTAASYLHTVTDNRTKLSSSLVSSHRSFAKRLGSDSSTNGYYSDSSPSKDDEIEDNRSKSLNVHTPYNLCFLRHGQSTWNRENRFIGWTDTPLTDDGVLEARVAGQMLAKSGILFDEVHTSLLRRSIRTMNIVLMEMQQEYIPVHKHWRLNERSYGDLVGLNKKETVALHGKDQVKRWRRSYDTPPPPMSPNHPFHPNRDPRYKNILHEIPASESLKCTVKRTEVYWNEVIAPALQAGKTLLIVGHENNLRSLLMKLEDIDETDIINLSLPRAVPLAYRLDLETLKPLDRADGLLDEATGFLRGEWLGGDKAVKQILERDHKQVYDTAITENLEVGKARDNWNTWMEFILGKPSPEQVVKALPVPEPESTVTTTPAPTTETTTVTTTVTATIAQPTKSVTADKQAEESTTVGKESAKSSTESSSSSSGKSKRSSTSTNALAKDITSSRVFKNETAKAASVNSNMILNNPPKTISTTNV